MLSTFAIAMTASLQGCSILIMASGLTLGELDTREIVYERFGPPDSVSVINAIDPESSKVREFEVEHYHVHAKFNTAMPMGSGSLLMFVFEPIMTCQASIEAAYEIIRGHDLAFVFDEQGNTIGRSGPSSFLDMGRQAGEINVLHWKRPDAGEE